MAAASVVEGLVGVLDDVHLQAPTARTVPARGPDDVLPIERELAAG